VPFSYAYQPTEGGLKSVSILLRHSVRHLLNKILQKKCVQYNFGTVLFFGSTMTEPNFSLFVFLQHKCSLPIGVVSPRRIYECIIFKCNEYGIFFIFNKIYLVLLKSRKYQLWFFFQFLNFILLTGFILINCVYCYSCLFKFSICTDCIYI
jgi:hypothetical protein